MASDIALTGAQRLALIDLKNNATLSSRTQRRLSSGLKINSVVDDSVNYFKSQALQNHAADFNNLKVEMGQAISHLQVSLEAIAGLETILQQMKGIIEASRSQTRAERELANTAITTLGAQFKELVDDASYGGSNLINSTTQGREVRFGLSDSSKLNLPGLDFLNAANVKDRVFSTADIFSLAGQFIFSAFMAETATAAGQAVGLENIGDSNSRVEVLADIISRIDGAVSRLRGHSQSLGSNVAILQARETFTDKYVTLNTVGAEKYTLADLNSEGANLVALQTRQQLGIQALSIAGQQQRAILTLLQ